jgi:hypothetical protein
LESEDVILKTWIINHLDLWWLIVYIDIFFIFLL